MKNMVPSAESFPACPSTGTIWGQYLQMGHCALKSYSLSGQGTGVDLVRVNRDFDGRSYQTH